MTPYYERDGIAIYHGDCLDAIYSAVVNQSHSTFTADLVVTDPPFAFAGGLSNGLSSMADSQFFSHWLKDVFTALYKVSAPEAAWFLWSDWRTISLYDEALVKAAPDRYSQRRVSQVLVHDREMVGMGSPFRNQTDWIGVVRGPRTDFGQRIPKDQPNVIRSYWYYGKHEFHPSEKDVRMAERLVTWGSDAGQLVIDPFMGSGTTLIAARNQGRRAIGIELDERYCEIAARRLEQQVLPIGDAA